MGEEATLVLSLVRAHLLEYPDYLSWVPSYNMIRSSKKRSYSVTVGGHYRRKALYARMLAALNCTCKLQEMVYPDNSARLGPPPMVRRRRFERDGEPISPRDRQYEIV